MVKIVKGMLPKHKETVSPWVLDFVDTACSKPLARLPQHLSEFPSRWPFPRGDLYHWIPLLNRFDSVLETFCSIYGLHEGPQTRDFTCELLERDAQEPQSLEQLGYAKDGDREVIEAILNFSRMLLENCGNRSIYASSPYLSDLLHSSSPSLLVSTLQIGTQLAQRYQASFKRMGTPHRHANAALLANHYNIDLDRVQQLAQPFARTIVTTESNAPATPATPSAKGKEKAYFNISASNKTSTVYANDLVSIARGESTPSSSPKIQKSLQNSPQGSPEGVWTEWGDVRVTYYQTASVATADPETKPHTLSNPSPSSPTPLTPTPVRRTSSLGQQHGQRTSALSNGDDTAISPARPTIGFTDDMQSPDRLKILEIPHAKVIATPIHELIKEYSPNLPRDTQFELLTKLRVAKALTSTIEARRQILTVRILAVTNLAYIHSENSFVEKVLKQDSDEPRRLQLIYQLAELIHPPTDGDVGVPRSLQTIALTGLEALAQHQSKYIDVCTALNTSVNHGVLLYIVRKGVAEMAHDEVGEKVTEKDEWRDALFSLLSHVATLPRAGSEMVTAGLVPILVEVLTLRTSIAERNYPRILNFLDTIVFNVREAFQILVNSDGLDAISNLIVYEVEHCSRSVEGEGFKVDYQSPAIDYQIPFFSQQSLKWLFKFIHHMMTTAGGYGGNFDRLLRNLIDSSQLLASLREIISHSHRFGSTVWTNSVSILNDFINNEPTSFAIIAEAGLSRELLQAVTGKEIKVIEEPKEPQSSTSALNDASSPTQTDNASIVSNADDDTTPHPPTADMLNTPRQGQLACGIMPSSEAITIIPQAFGAICLNSSGMQMFLASNALQSFFEIFESPKHVQCMSNEHNLPANLGATFDELVRHHPPLKNAIINAILDMVARVAHLCQEMADKKNVGAKLWNTNDTSRVVVAESDDNAKGKSKTAISDTDVEMGGISTDQPSSDDDQASAVYTSATPYIDVLSTFLTLMFSNSAVRLAFMEKGGTEYVLNLAEVGSLAHDYSAKSLHRVICMLAEQKPHLVVPSLLKRTQSAADSLTAFTLHKGAKPYFGAFVSEDIRNATDHQGAQLEDGTKLVKGLVNIHCLLNALRECFQTPVYNHRSTTTFFNQINVADYYVQLVQRLGPLLAAATREDFILQMSDIVPSPWKRATRSPEVTGHIISGQHLEDMDLETRAINEIVVTDSLPTGVQATSNTTPLDGSGQSAPGSTSEVQTVSKRERESAHFKNYQTLRYLLSRMPPTVSDFFQVLGKSLTSNKRSPDIFQRQSYTSIADALADTVLSQLNQAGNESSVENYTFWIVMLGTIKDLLFHASRHNERPYECITLVLYAFKSRKGFNALNNMLEVFTQDIRQYNRQITTSDGPANETSQADLKVRLATLGTRHILSLYLLLVTGKNIVDSPQTNTMVHQSEKDKTKANYFSPGQLLVELRMAVLPTVRRLWESDLAEKATHQIPNRLIDIIRAIAVADYENGAYSRADKVPADIQPVKKAWKPSSENLAKLTQAGFSDELAREALYRCNGSHSLATEYCRALSSNLSGGRNPIPTADLDTSSESAGSSRPQTSHSTGTATPVAEDPMVETSVTPTLPTDSPEIVLNDDSLGSILEVGTASSGSTTEIGSQQALSSTPLVPVATQPNIVTIDDLNEERAAIRERLIDRCLDVINAHGEVTFEVAELITTVVEKSDDPTTMRKEMGETLVNALMSFAAEEDVRIVGKKVAAYAHLLALMLQDKSFYNASVTELKDNLPTLLEFVKLSPTHSSEESSPWIAHILLIIETLLSEDSQPCETDWKFPSMENKEVDKPVLKTTEPVVSYEHRTQLFEYILDILPRIGKDESLALAVLRVLVILTRARALAQAMGEKKNIQRLFVMAKQLAGATSVRLQSPLLLILRHIIEDDETIKQIMRSEIKAFFETVRSQRHQEVSNYIRQLSSLAIRAPELFVEVTNQMVKLVRWQSNVETSPGRQTLVLKDQYQRSASGNADIVLPPLHATGLLSLQDVKPSTEASEANTETLETAKLPPLDIHKEKPPIVENPDGVVHFLLCEILNYKDVEDKDAATQSTEKIDTESLPGSTDAVMTDAASSTDTSSSTDSKDSKKATKPKFKWEEHPIYIYRCFLLQCLTELLSSYNRTKIEFINFKRSVPPQAMTPSKPRSSVINYFLTDLIPIGTLEHTETNALYKKQTTSTWTNNLLTGLLCKTGEQILDRKRDNSDYDDEPDLHYVRKFVLDNILKAYKDASSSNEPLDTKYARMLSLADLMTHIMSGKEILTGLSDSGVSSRSGSQLRRLMFEKGFITALTSSIADIDLNFPGAKRAVKHILRPLKVLTQTACDLSDAGMVAIPGQSEEDEIASASSLSDGDDDREETPDLFRNSTLGMFEPGRDEESSSGSDEDEDEDMMYEGEFDDEEMDYGDEMAEDDEDNVSDEDEEIEGMGEIEGLPGDVNVEVIMDEDDDDDEDDDEDPSDEDDDGDSEDMDDMDEDDERVEIIDEDGNHIHLDEGGDEDDWEDEARSEGDEDDEEEEDYEGRAQDEEDEEHIHGMGGMARGAISHLVRALGSDDHEGAVEILQRIEDEGMDPDELENYLDEQDAEDDEEDDEDMDDEDEQFDIGIRPPPGMDAVVWDEDSLQPPPMGLSRHNHQHRTRHGIPDPFSYFPGGHRDPLGGMLHPLLPQSLSALDTQLERSTLGLVEATHRLNTVTELLAALQEGSHQDRALHQSRLDPIRSLLEDNQSPISAVSESIFTPPIPNTNPGPVPNYVRGAYRSHRPGPTPRTDDGINPLLQRSGSGLARDDFQRGLVNPNALPGRPNEVLLDIDLRSRSGPFGESPAALLNDLITSLPLPGSLHRHGAQLHFHVTGGPRGEMSRDLQAMFGVSRGTRFGNTGQNTPQSGSATFFTPQSTVVRWTEEAKLLFGANHADKAYLRLLIAVMAVVVPPALQQEIESRKIAEEAEEKRKIEALAAKVKKEAEEKAAREKAEAEAKEAREAEEAAERARTEENAAAGEPMSDVADIQETSDAAIPQPMEGVETAEDPTATAPEETGPGEDRPRVLVTIRGNQIDITDLGIDEEFLRELPEDIQEEVITSAVTERRSQAAAAGGEPSEIDQEFLDALPAEIRDEIIQQERQDRRRREREELRRQAQQNGAANAAAQEMDAASILATLAPDLRRQVLLEQNEEVLAQLPPEYVAQARAGMRDLPLSNVRGLAGRTPRPGPGEAVVPRVRRTIVQMLDKAGVATLLRLMFVFQQESLRTTLFQVLQNISENRHNRAEVISTLLHILQDGSADMSAVERSFAHLSLRAKQPKDKDPKTPQPLKRTLTGSTFNVVASSDVSPLMVVQQCLSTLIYLTKVNIHVPGFFLTEHESAGGLKRSASRLKGKGKETKTSRYALNSLLTLLDRKLIMESSSVMESLSDLLSRVTTPLQSLARNQNKAIEEAKKATEPTSVTEVTTTSAASLEAPTSTVLDQPTDTANRETTTVPEHPADTTHIESAASTAHVEEPASMTGDPATVVAESSEKQVSTEPKDTDKKKDRWVPPVIPDSNLKLVINIFVARECSAKTFRETLTTIKNLSCIPGAKAVFGKELIRKAQELGEVILLDLEELLPQIQKATTGTEIQGLALAKFSPSGSDQNKLLRVLTALDHLFDPKQNLKRDLPAEEETELATKSSKDVEKQDLLATLYENSTFGPMWEKLSACLSAIRLREHMLNVATILLPLIESLMVVCKNTTLKDVPIVKPHQMDLSSPPPESRMENLFFTFTEEHRKILNDLVRHTPKLMSGTFSLLVKNPKVLEFDNKRNYFTRSIHNRNTQTRQTFAALQLSVRRDQVFHDSFKSLYFKSGEEMKFGKLSIRFHGEEGVDAGGVTREWFQVLSRQMFDPGYALFVPVSSDRTTFHPNSLSNINPEHLMFFKFIGRVIGKALYEGRVLDCHFSRAVYKRILGKAVSVKDMESLDPEYYKSVVWMLENDITDIITETFSVDNDKFGVVETIDLIPDGRNIPVTEENKQEYIRLMVEFKLTGSVSEQLDEFLKGFHDIIPAELIAIFNEQELELLISGLPEIDVDDWKSNTEYHNYTASSPQIQWFWRAVRSFDKEERAKLLQFVTGTSKVPLNGFKELEGMNGFSRFNIHRDYGNKDRLPSSHTCFNQLDLPEYENYEALRQQVLMAITAGSEYFGFA